MSTACVKSALDTLLISFSLFQHQGSEKEDETKQQFFAVDSPLYLITLVALGVLCVGFTLLGLCVNKAVVKTCNKNEEDGRERQNNNGGDGV